MGEAKKWSSFRKTISKIRLRDHGTFLSSDEERLVQSGQLSSSNQFRELACMWMMGSEIKERN